MRKEAGGVLAKERSSRINIYERRGGRERSRRGRKEDQSGQRESERRKRAACAIHAFCYYTTRPLSFAGYTRAFLSVCEISFCGLCRRTPPVRTFALATYSRGSPERASVSSRLSPRVHKHTHRSIRDLRMLLWRHPCGVLRGGTAEGTSGERKLDLLAKWPSMFRVMNDNDRLRAGINKNARRRKEELRSGIKLRSGRWGEGGAYVSNNRMAQCALIEIAE